MRICQASSFVTVRMPKDICTMQIAAHQQERCRGEVGPIRPSPGLNKHVPNHLSNASLKSMNISLPYRSWVLAQIPGTLSGGEARKIGHIAHSGSAHLAYATWRTFVAPRPCRSFYSMHFLRFEGRGLFGSRLQPYIDHTPSCILKSTQLHSNTLKENS